jgi:pimeloyl-ACP methyl ester carboxylesterase
MGDSDKDFTEHGFIDALRTRKLSVDTVSANATFGYYARRTLLERVETDILAPARAKGYSEIWFAGVSMGGLGSVLVAKNHASELKGIVLLAPYLGDDDVLEEIQKAGGVAKWQPQMPLDKDDYQRDLWRWMKDAIAQPESAPQIYLAAGDQDKLGDGHRILAAALPKARVFHTPGKHDWGPWLVLWNDFLDHSDFRDHCGEKPAETK